MACFPLTGAAIPDTHIIAKTREHSHRQTQDACFPLVGVLDMFMPVPMHQVLQRRRTARGVVNSARFDGPLQQPPAPLCTRRRVCIHPSILTYTQAHAHTHALTVLVEATEDTDTVLLVNELLESTLSITAALLPSASARPAPRLAAMATMSDCLL